MAFGVEDVVVAGGGDVGNDHAVFDPFLEVDVLVQRDVGPVVDELDAGVDGADAVDPAEALNDADRVPVDVVVDQVVAVLKVLAFGDAVGANQEVDLGRFVWQNPAFSLARGEKSVSKDWKS